MTSPTSGSYELLERVAIGGISVIGAHLHHPNIVEVYDFGEAQGAHFIARELVHGQPLDTVLSQARGAPSVLS